LSWLDQGASSQPVAVPDAEDRRQQDQETAKHQADDGQSARYQGGSAQRKLHFKQSSETEEQ